MIIPVRCFTCGEMLADKWMPYITAVQNLKNEEGKGKGTKFITALVSQNVIHFVC